ncbi:YfiT family bacillithiol transferase [Niallia nealsonii]|uniref:Putative metal-dependent hydrolase CWS01_09540 n=1 Tax=Niallia nealsonii TaxID=115979 RepID=A0A2N0Z3B1_9BACI|nr:putative metal-dependent hydrolase [Niallia nealsonii]PKG23998.1 metal-dependent hydrolase [Niallia nealsonii]
MDERYPIGHFSYQEDEADKLIDTWITEIEMLPEKLAKAVSGLSEEQLETPYRVGGWTVRQVVHHLADSHLNAYTRFKLAVTEQNPIIKPYEEGEWAELADYKEPIEVSVQLLQALHTRLVVLLKSLNQEQLQKVFIHPDSGQVLVKENIGIYAWHGNHHLAHITSLCKKKGWF